MRNHKVLIITYYWPNAGGPGVQRWLKFTKYLTDFGIEVFVFVPENPSYPIIDTSLEKEINPKITVIKSPIWEPYQWAEKLSKKNKDFKAGQFDTHKKQGFLARLSVFIRGNFFIPDARVFWVKPSVRKIEKILKENDIQAIITTGPPHSVHLIGNQLKNKNNSLKWIADFRDPWTEISYYSQLKLTKIADKIHHKLEREIMNTADIVLATSSTDAENFKKLGAKRTETITNGFDIEFSENLISPTHFVISYIGMLEQLRNPKNFWLAISELIQENALLKSKIKLKFVGKIDTAILVELENLGLKNFIENKGYLAHNESVNEMKNSAILLLTNFDSAASKGIIPGKLFEYLATQNTVISIGPKDSAVEKILQETEAGKHFDYSQKEEIKLFILQKFTEFPTTSHRNNSKIRQYSRKNLTEKLAKLILSTSKSD